MFSVALLGKYLNKKQFNGNIYVLPVSLFFNRTFLILGICLHASTAGLAESPRTNSNQIQITAAPQEKEPTPRKFTPEEQTNINEKWFLRII